MTHYKFSTENFDVECYGKGIFYVIIRRSDGETRDLQGKRAVEFDNKLENHTTDEYSDDDLCADQFIE